MSRTEKENKIKRLIFMNKGEVKKQYCNHIQSLQRR
jgi:hypothetical protein